MGLENTLALAMNHLGITTAAVLFALYPMAKVGDWIFGQPRNGGQFDENRVTKVQRVYSLLGMATILLVILAAMGKIPL